MEIIHELEKQARGVYCGAVGYSGPEQSCFNVPIRTLELHRGKGRMGIGSGIVADSIAEEEWEECLLKGHFLTRKEANFQLIETMLWQYEQGYFLLDYHLDRLQDSARYFHFHYPAQEVRSLLEQRAAELTLDAVKNGNEQQRVRLLLHRDGCLEISSSLFSDLSEPDLPVKVIFSRKQVDAGNPHRLHKTTRRHLYNYEFHRAAEQGCFDVLFTNTAGQVTEGAISNIFVRLHADAPLLTPPVTCGLLAGTYRRMLLEQGRAVEQVLRIEDMLQAKEIYAANSVRGLVAVRLGQDRGIE
jgi:para-aminobenzoate synthetase/4-amino-4-deoxychorismate lyase